MPSVLVRIRSLYSRFPKAEKRVADYVLANAEEALRSSVQEFARAGGVSVASVSHFVRDMGLVDLKNFRLELARENGSTARYVFEQINSRDSDEEIARKVFLGTIRSIEDTTNIVSFSDLMAAARAIVLCRRLILIGIGTSGYVATACREIPAFRGSRRARVLSWCLTRWRRQFLEKPIGCEQRQSLHFSDDSVHLTAGGNPSRPEGRPVLGSGER